MFSWLKNLLQKTYLSYVQCFTVSAGLMETIAVKNLLERAIGTLQDQGAIIIHIDGFAGEEYPGH